MLQYYAIRQTASLNTIKIDYSVHLALISLVIGMENRIIKYIETIIIEEYKLIQSLEFDVDNPHLPDSAEVDSFCKNLGLRGEKAIKDVKKYLYDVAGLAVPPPPFNPKTHQGGDFFERYHTRLSLLAISYETLSNSVATKSPRLTDITINNVSSLNMFLSQLDQLHNGYKRVASLKDLRSRLVLS